MCNAWWNWEKDKYGNTYTIVYTENLGMLKDKKLKIKPFAWYYNFKGGLWGIQYKVIKGDDNFKYLKKKLKLRRLNKIL